MAYTIKMVPNSIQSVAYSSITSSYTTLATVAAATRIVKIVNNTNGLILLSWNGDASTDNDVLPANSFFLYDISSNKINDNGCFIAEGTVFSLKYSGSAPNSGSVYFVSLKTGVF